MRYNVLAELPRDGRQSDTALSIQRGTGRLLASLGAAIVYEMQLTSGRRADIVALMPAGDLWIVEIKSSLADLRADRKWRDYRCHCDRLFFAGNAEMSDEVFPADAGLIMADSWGAEMLREAPEHRLASATRRSMTLRFARLAASRLHGLHDPTVGFGPDGV